MATEMKIMLERQLLKLLKWLKTNKRRVLLKKKNHGESENAEAENHGFENARREIHQQKALSSSKIKERV